MTSDWTQQTALPLETSDVWQLMVSGFNRNEVMAAGNVCAATARAMMAEAACAGNGSIKTCNKCCESKPLDAFPLAYGNGNTWHRSTCRACEAARMRLRRELLAKPHQPLPEDETAANSAFAGWPVSSRPVVMSFMLHGRMVG